MNLLIVGNDAAFNECKARLGDAHHYQRVDAMVSGFGLHQPTVVFDFSDQHSQQAVEFYCQQTSAIVFLNTVFTTLSAVLGNQATQVPVVGFCGLPTFFNRPVLEVSLLHEGQKTRLETIMQALSWKCTVIKDQVGFITPRVVCMIINEAFETWRDGVASKEDIDLSMKLGTNYPFGPFEWAERIGMDNVRKLLMALEKETGDERYRVMF